LKLKRKQNLSNEESKTSKLPEQDSNKDVDKIKQFLLNEKEFNSTVKSCFEQLDPKKTGYIPTKTIGDTIKKITTTAKLNLIEAKDIDGTTKDHWKGSTPDKANLQDITSFVKELFEAITKPKPNLDDILPKEPDTAPNAFLTEPIQEQLPIPPAPKPLTEAEIRKKLADTYQKYIDDTGLALAFKVIFAEILTKKIPEENIFSYTVSRLRQIGNDISYIQNAKKASKKL